MQGLSAPAACLKEHEEAAAPDTRAPAGLLHRRLRSPEQRCAACLRPGPPAAPQAAPHAGVLGRPPVGRAARGSGPRARWPAPPTAAARNLQEQPRRGVSASRQLARAAGGAASRALGRNPSRRQALLSASPTPSESQPPAAASARSLDVDSSIAASRCSASSACLAAAASAATCCCSAAASLASAVRSWPSFLASWACASENACVDRWPSLRTMRTVPVAPALEGGRRARKR